MRIALVSCLELPEPDHDEALLLEALKALGHDASALAWDDESIDWSSFDAGIIRATWNYAHQPDEFEAWIDRAGAQTVLLNPVEVLKANLHKAYLIELEQAGVRVIPTQFFSKGDEVDVSSIASEQCWSKLVIKPSISAGSYATRVFDFAQEPEAAQSFLDEYLAKRDMMIQRFMPSVATSGEIAMIHIDGDYSHSILKQPRFADDDESVSRIDDVSETHFDVAKQVLHAANAKDLLYARVDLIEDDEGNPMLSELELLEPSLFLPHDEHAAKKMASAIERRVTTVHS